MKKIGNSFKGILGGFIIIIIGIGLLWWNEGNNVKNLKTTAEAAKSLIDVKSDSVDAKNEGKLIATNGKLINEQELEDETFKVKIKTPLLKRIVEVYQWDEDSSTDDDGDTTYTYSKKWSSDIIDSGNFHRSGHDNPTHKEYDDDEYTSDDVKVGAFSLSIDQIRRLSTKGVYNTFDEETLSELNLTKSGNYITNSKDLNKPEIGDMRISFVYNDSTEISVLAVQQRNTFVDFVSKAGKTINRVEDGTKTGAEMVENIKKENNLLKWILRAVGALLIISGIGTILKPISTISGFVPILGSLVGAAVGLISFILGLALSLIVIAVAWIRFRPILGIGLLAAAAALIIFIITRGKKAKPDTTIQTVNETPIETTSETPSNNNNE